MTARPGPDFGELPLGHVLAWAQAGGLIAGRGCVIAVDLPCVGCGYNLRTLSAASLWPECGGSALRTLTARALAGHQCLHHVGTALCLSTIATGLLLVGLVCAAVVLFGVQAPAVGMVAVLLMCAGGGLGIFGFPPLALTNPHARDARWLSSGRVLIGAFLFVVASGVGAAIGFATGRNGLTMASLVVAALLFPIVPAAAVARAGILMAQFGQPHPARHAQRLSRTVLFIEGIWVAAGVVWYSNPTLVTRPVLGALGALAVPVVAACLVLLGRAARVVSDALASMRSKDSATGQSRGQ